MITLYQARKRFAHDPEAERRAAEREARAAQAREEEAQARAAREEEETQRFEEALGERKVATKLGAKLAARRKERTANGSGPRFEILNDGTDARLNFGRHSGRTLSEIASDHEGKGYLRWMQEQKFPAELMRVVASYL